MCMRNDSHPLYGYGKAKTTKNGSPWWLYHLDGRSSTPRPLPDVAPVLRSVPKEKPKESWTFSELTDLQAKFRDNLHPHYAAKLSNALRLPTWSFDLIEGGIGRNHTKIGKDVVGWSNLEYDGNGNPTAIKIRTEDAGKFYHTNNSTRKNQPGLVLGTSWANEGSPLLLVEGCSDVLACAAAGLPSVGRPSNVGGVNELRELLKPLSREREVIVVGEGDRKPDGRWPGRWGAYWTAMKLARELSRPIGWAVVRAEDGKDSRGYLTRRVGPDSSREKCKSAGSEFLHLLRSDLHFALPGCLELTESVFMGGKAPCGVNVGLVGKSEGTKRGRNCVVHRPCNTWKCSYCRAWKTDRCSAWLYRIVGEWCAPDRIPDGVPLISENAGKPIDGMTIPDKVQPPEPGDPGPWNLYAAIIRSSGWRTFMKNITRIEGGVEFCRIEFDPAKLTEAENYSQAGNEVPKVSPFVYVLYSYVHRQMGTKSLCQSDGYLTLCLVAIAPETALTPKFRNQLQTVTSDGAILLASQALAAIPDAPSEGARFQPVNFSTGWEMAKPMPTSGQYERRFMPQHRPASVREILTLLGVSVIETNIASPASGTQWLEGSLGGALNAWMFQELTAARQPISKKPLSKEDVARLFKSWREFLDLAEPPIQDGEFVRQSIKEKLHAEPLPGDLADIRDSEKCDAEANRVEL
jgi:hypothetical protein